ncbi:MAG TPA: hypothetical protein VGH43_05585 [Jatrophihabitans sp.]
MRVGVLPVVRVGVAPVVRVGVAPVVRVGVVPVVRVGLAATGVLEGALPVRVIGAAADVALPATSESAGRGSRLVIRTDDGPADPAMVPGGVAVDRVVPASAAWN